MKIIFLDAKSVGEDIDYSDYQHLGDFVKYDYTSYDEIADRVSDADVIITNKCLMNAHTLRNASKVKLVCVTATGTNNLDKEYLEKKGIAWRNVAGYSTESVAQHTFAMLFYLLEKLDYYDNYVKEGRYANDISFTHFAEHFREVRGMTWGIIGLGNIGRRVADIAKCFGANVIYYSTSGKNIQPDYAPVDFETLLKTSDIISVHAPLTEATENLMNLDAFKQMKNTAIFLNLGRGGIVVEEDLVQALENHWIAAAGLDVLREEPMSQNCPLLPIKDSKRLLITPHIAWASVEARTALMKLVFQNITDFYRNEQ